MRSIVRRVGSQGIFFQKKGVVIIICWERKPGIEKYNNAEQKYRGVSYDELIRSKTLFAIECNDIYILVYRHACARMCDTYLKIVDTFSVRIGKEKKIKTHTYTYYKFNLLYLNFVHCIYLYTNYYTYKFMKRMIKKEKND